MEQEWSRSGGGVERTRARRCQTPLRDCPGVPRGVQSERLALTPRQLALSTGLLSLIASDSDAAEALGRKQSTPASEDFVNFERPPPVETTAFWLVGLTPSSGRETIGVALPPRQVAFSLALSRSVTSQTGPLRRVSTDCL